MKIPNSILIAFLLFSTLIFGQTTRYVTSAGAGTKSGASWANASNDLQAMINASSSGDKIYVAVGIYMPNRRADATGTITPHDRRNSFVMKQGVSIYGGFDPANGITDDLNSRILPGTGSGSLLSGNLGNINTIDDNAYHVVVAAGGSNAGLLDGFIVQDGNARGDNTMTINGQGVTSKGGGGIVSVNAEVKFNNCWIRGNQSNSGGGIYIAMASSGLSFTSHFTNCIFSGNYVSTLSGNNGNGGAIYSLSGRARLYNCTISSNRASGGRGGAILSSGNIYLNNTILYGNTAANGQNGIRIDGGGVIAEYCLIGDSGDSPTSSTNVISGNPSFVNETGTGGTMPTTAGDYRIHSNSSCIDTGNNSLVPSGIVTHIGGFGRIRGETVDRGAFEGAGIITFHVKSGGTGNGLSWADASGDLQLTINRAQAGDVIFVAAGTYKPNRKANALGAIVPNHRDNAFVLKNDVKMYGGFAGNETSLSQRDLSNPANKTILSGDFNDDDVVTGSGTNLNISGNDENAYHVVISARLSANTVLDGFTIQGGNANGVVDDFITVNGESISKYNGGGLINKYMVSGQSSTPTIINCHFTQNHCISEGGGLYSIFSGNNIFNIINCIFSLNLAGPSGGGRGGAITNRYNSKIKIINTTIWGNRAMAGGALGNMQSSAVITIQNSIIYGNNSLIYNEGSVTYSSSLVQGLTSTDNGNINGNLNPLFVNASSGDFRLQLLSPVANRGNNSYVPAGVTTDIAGNDRIQDCAVDIGAYESNPIPAPAAEDQTFCAGNVLSDLIVEGENLKFYDVAEGGTPLAPDTEVVAGTYYVSQTINSCESPRATVTLTYAIETPTAPSPQNFSFSGIPVSALEAAGENLQWYNVTQGGEALLNIPSTGTYYVSQTIDGCESGRLPVDINFSSTVRYVKPVATGSGDGSGWENASDDLQAMLNVSSNGDYIFIAGGVYKPNRKANALDIITPNHRENAFVLKSDVKVYGGFAGTETSVEERNLANPANKTILSGDFNDDDIIDGSGETLTFSNNGENVYHVVIVDNEGYLAEIDGITIKGGNANVNSSASGFPQYEAAGLYGGGLVEIRNCTFTENYAIFYAGAIRVRNEYASSIGAKIINTVFYKNKTGEGSAVRYSGSSYPPLQMHNCVFYGNHSGSSYDGVFCPTTDDIKVYNSIIYGNYTRYPSSSPDVRFYDSLVENILSAYYSSPYNNIDTDPLFVDAANGNFRLQLLSPANNRGNNSYVPASVTTDIAGNDRIQDCAVDMGAYESEPLPAPVAEDQEFCAGNTVSDLTAEGENLQWYDVAEGGSPLDENTELATGTYYVAQTINDCESPRTEVSVMVYGIPPIPVADTDQIFCAGTVSGLTAEGENLQWYDVAEGGSPLDENAELTTGTYYVSQTLNGCESPRTEVSVTVYGIPPAPEADADQTFCAGNTFSDLMATGENLQWYDVAGGGEPLALDTILTPGTYYVSQTTNSCEGPRAAININAQTEAPTAPSPQNFSATTTVADLTATGENLQWFDVEEGGTALSSSTVITTGTYYVSQAIDGCESSRIPVVVSISFIRYVKPVTSGTGDGSSWENASNDLQLMINNSEEGDIIFVAGGTYYPLRIANDLDTFYPNYFVYNSFVIKKDIKIYGGFAGTETSLDERVPDAENPSILSGDGKGTPYYDDDNSLHVMLILGSEGHPITSETVIDGFTITGGYAFTGGDETVNDIIIDSDIGGGIYCVYASPVIRSCSIEFNKTLYFGGGMFVAYGSPVIENSLFRKNYSGYMIGADIYFNNIELSITNSTFWGGGHYSPFAGSGDAYVRNSIIYGYPNGNQSVDIHAYNSLINKQTSTANGNINGNTNPQFVNPENGDFRLQATSPVINKGNNSYVPVDLTTDIAGNDRIQDCAVDMGAYESDPITAPVAEDQTTCAGTTVSDLMAEGENLQWYDVADGGLPLDENTELTTGTYYVAQTINGCEGPRTEVNVTVNDILPTPVADANQIFCGGTISNLTATGENLQWYDMAEGGIPLSPDTILIAEIYYVSQTINGCESPRIPVNIIYQSQPPTASNQTFCTGTVSDLTATGENLQWYDLVEGGSPLDENTELTTGIYYVSQIINGCESLRTEVSITVYGIPIIPVTDTDQIFCTGTVSDLTATGENLQWYDVAEGGLPLDENTELATGTYYVSQTIEDCESPRTEVSVTVYGIPSAPEADADQTFCAGNTFSDLMATGENLQWYNVIEGGTPLDENTELTTGTYYVSQTINSCESPRASVNITYQTEPPTAWNQTFCAGDTVSDLTAEGENLQWYDAAEGGIPLSPETLLDAGTYYVSQAIDSCESNRIPVNISYQTEAPTAPSPQSYPFGTTVLVSGLVATGENLQWYITETGGTPLDPEAEIVDGTYYVSQTIGECESGRTEVTVNYIGIRYVKPVASGSGDGSSWDNASDDLQEMINISEGGNFIFVAGGTYKPIRPANNLSTIDPANRNNAFVLKDGVRIYGGFAGTETYLEQRDLSDTANKSVLSGDFNGNDIVSGSGNTLNLTNLNENAYHVVISAANDNSIGIGIDTLLDGFTITGGNSNNPDGGFILVNSSPVFSTYGGGLYNLGYSSPVISNCTFTGNMADSGGAVYANVANLQPYLTFINCLFSKNLAINYGGAARNEKRAQYFNCTIWGNKAMSGTGLLNFSEDIIVSNSIVYGNSDDDFGSIAFGEATQNYSLIQDQTSTSDGNIPGNIDPLFIDPENSDFRLQTISPVINKGNNSYVPSGITMDIAGNNRIQLGTVDMGAYESSRYGVIWTSSDNWLNGLEPDQEKDVFIEGDLSVGTDYESFSAKSLTVEEGGKLTINEENAITVYDRITNDAGAENFIIKSGGNLIQTTDYELDDNEGKITVERNSQPIVRLDYAFWSSPVKGQELQAFSPMTLPNRIYTYETNSSNESTNGAYEILSNVNDHFVQGKGYLFRAPNDWISENSETGIPYLGIFTGEPTNGNINIPTYPNGFTSVGNPYPSNVDPELFLNANAGNISNLFFWNNPQRAYSEETESWGYTGSRYVAYSNLGFNNPDYEGKSISAGQGFIVYTTGSSVNFDNSMRTAAEESFFKINDTERHRFWLKLSDKEEHELNQILIGYMTGASNGIDQQIEGEQFGYEGSAIYSLIDEQKYAIQGRALPFETTDVVPLGFKAEQDGKYTISLTSFDGLFAEGNTNIYLNDKLLETIHNLLESDYTFESQEGEFKDRFEILYQKQDGTMGANDEEENAIRIYQHNQNIIIESKTEKISSVELYDLQGRSLYRNENVNAGYLQISAKRFGPTILIVKAQTQSGKIKTKKMLNK